MEWYLQPALVAKDEWDAHIHMLKGGVTEEIASGADPLSRIDALKRSWLGHFEQAVLARAASRAPLGVLFSGGVDSTFIAFVLYRHGIPFTCYTVGFQDEGTKEPEDVVEAKRVVEHFGWQHMCRVFTLDELEPIVKETAKMLGDVATPVTVGVGTVVVAAAMLAAQDGVAVLFGGLGSEEVFAGYERHEHAADLESACWDGLLQMYARDMIRDTTIASALHISILTPFLDEQVLFWAMCMPASEKIRNGEKKHVLRVIAQEYGLPQEFAFRPKRAAQYGSRFDGALERFAKRQGLSKQAYITSLR